MPIVDDFEAYDSTTLLSDRYDGNSGAFGVVDSSTTGAGTSPTGGQCLQYTAGDGSWYNLRGGSGAAFGTGLNDTPEPGDTFEFYLQTGANKGQGVICWGIQENAWVADGGYALRFHFGNTTLELQKLPSGGTNFSTLATFDTPSNPLDNWYRYQVDWATDGTITVTLYNETDSQIDQVTATDSEFGAGGVAYEMNQGDTLLWLDGYQITAQPGQTVSAPASTTSASTPAPAVSVQTPDTVSTPVSSATSATPAPTVSGGAVTVAAPTSTAPSSTPTPTVSVSDDPTTGKSGDAKSGTFRSGGLQTESTVSPPVSTAASATPLPTLSAGTATISAPESPATSNTPAPSITGTSAVSVAAAVSASSATTPAPTVAAGSATLGVPVSATTTTTPPPGVSGTASTTVSSSPTQLTTTTDSPAVFTISTQLTWDSASEWDAAASESGVVHESFGDLAGAGTIQLGYPSFDRNGSALEHYFPLDEDSGSTAYDATGTTDGTINGATVGQTGTLGTTCYSFDGTDDYVEFGPPTISGSITVLCWVNLDTFDTSGTGTKIVAGPYENSSGQTAWELKIPSNGTLQFNSFDGTENGASADISSLSASNWHLFGGRYTGSGWDILVNGSVATDNTFGDQSVGPLPSTNGNRAFGGQHKTDAPAYEDFTPGKIESVRLYSRSLSASEFQAHYDTVASGGSIITSAKTA